jgi:hypothetical protein
VYTQDNPAGHYAAFEASQELRRVGEKLVWEVEHGNWHQHDALIEVIERFDHEAGRALVLDAVVAMALSDTAIALCANHVELVVRHHQQAVQADCSQTG